MKFAVLPIMRGLETGSLIHVSFERGSKSVMTSEVQLGETEDSDGERIAEFDEVLSLGVTLYRNAQGEIQVGTCVGFIFRSLHLCTALHCTGEKWYAFRQATKARSSG